VVLTPRRWRQVFEKLRFSEAMVTNKPVTKESTKETVKTIARGMPGVFRCDRGDLLACFLFCTQGCGRIGRPAFPAPSVFRGGTLMKKLARNTRRDREVVSINAGRSWALMFSLPKITPAGDLASKH
jgi:hypothetical protein